MIGPVLRRALAGRLPSRREVLLMLHAKRSELQALLETAYRLRIQHKGEEVILRGRVTACGSQALAQARTAAQMGCSSVVLCPEECSAAEITEVIRSIKQELGLHIALCLGDRSYDEYAAWRQAGADEYMLPHECSNLRVFARLHGGRSAAEMATRYLWLNGLGYRVAGGITIGLEDQTEETLADDIEVLRNAEARALRIRPLDGGAELLRVLAITRLCLPEADIWVATDRPELQSQAVTCGANLVVTALPGAAPCVEAIPITSAQAL